MVWYLAGGRARGDRTTQTSVADRNAPMNLDARLLAGRYGLAPHGSHEDVKVGGWRSDAFSVLVCVFLCVALMAGGSSSDAVSAGIVQFSSAPILGIGLWRLFDRPVSPGIFWLLIIMVATAAFVLVQMAPLPPEVWRALPGRRMLVDGYAAAGMTLPWLPISLAPWATQNAALGLIPPAAMICAVASLEESARRALVVSMAIIAIISVGLGVMQITGGADSPLRIYPFTNRDSAVGFFANRNHQAAFLAAAIPLAPLLMMRMNGRDGRQNFFWVAAAGGFILVVSVGAATTGSRAGALLVVLGFLGAVVIAARAWRRRWAPAAALAATAALTAGLIVLSGNTVLVDRLRMNPGNDGRLTISPIVATAAAAFAPLGSGVGSFPVVYQIFEHEETLAPAYINHAHNEYLELWMECGWAGVALMGAFLAWWCTAGFAAFRARPSEAAALRMAGALIVGMFLLHSIVDYPLRTPALATVFGLACSLMLQPPLERRIGSPGANNQNPGRQPMDEGGGDP